MKGIDPPPLYMIPGELTAPIRKQPVRLHINHVTELTAAPHAVVLADPAQSTAPGQVLPAGAYAPTNLHQPIQIFSLPLNAPMNNAGAAQHPSSVTDPSSDDTDYDKEDVEYYPASARKSKSGATRSKGLPKASTPKPDQLVCPAYIQRYANVIEMSYLHRKVAAGAAEDEVVVLDAGDVSKKRDAAPAAQDAAESGAEKAGRTSPPKTDDGRILGDVCHCSGFLDSSWTTDIIPITVSRSPSFGKWFAIPEIGVHRGKLFCGTIMIIR